MKKWLKYSIAFLAVGTLLAGCGQEKTNESSKKADTPKIEQKIAVSLPAQLSTIDTTQTTDKVTFTVVQHIFEGLYRLDDDSKVVPGLAESVDISEDGKTYTFHLRDDAKWSDGTPITAGDFLFAWKRLVNPATQGPNAYWLDNVINSKEIRNGKKDIDTIGLKAVDDQTFEVQLINPQPSFLSVVSIGWLAPQNEKYVTEKGDKYAATSEDAIYSGPFVLKNWKQTSDTWELAPNPYYYDKKKVKLTQVDGSTIKEDNTGINLYQTGDLDLTKISGQFVQQYKNDKAKYSELEVVNYYLDLNKKANTPLANVELRKAIAQAVDRESLAKKVLNDGSKALSGLVPANLYQNKKGEDFRKYSGNYNEYDVKVAKEHFEKAKKDLGDDIKITLLVADTENSKKIAEFVQNQLETHLKGLKIEVTPQPANNVNQARRDKNYEMTLSGWIAGSNDLNSYFNLFQSTSAYNFGSYNNAKYDELLEKASTTDANDEAAFYQDYKAAEEILLTQDAAQVPLVQTAANYLINPKVKHIVFHTYGDYYNLREAYVTK